MKELVAPVPVIEYVAPAPVPTLLEPPIPVVHIVQVPQVVQKTTETPQLQKIVETPVDVCVRGSRRGCGSGGCGTEVAVTMLAYFTYTQKQATKDAGSIAGMTELHIMITTEPAYLSYPRIPKRNNDRSTAEHETNEELVVPVPAYFNFTLCQTWKDKESNGCYFGLGTVKDPKTAELIYRMGKTKDTKKINETLARSEFFFNRCNSQSICAE